MKRYKIKKFLKEFDSNLKRYTYIAVIEDAKNPDHPFKMTVENVKGRLEALKEIDVWIAEKVREDKAREEAKDNPPEDDSLLNELNEGLEADPEKDPSSKPNEIL